MMRTPYLIQRGQINTPIAGADSRLTHAVALDYMGSAEFEFGALPESLRYIESVADCWVCRVVDDIQEGDVPLRVWSALSDDDFAKYVGYLKILRAAQNDRDVRRFSTKESVRFEVDYKHGKFSRTDFWWDIDNHVMFGFKKEFMERVGDYVANSLIYMNQQKAGR